MVPSWMSVAAQCVIMLQVSDLVQNEKGGNGVFFNLGPTGIRALLTDKDGKILIGGEGIQYLVKYVFPDSPANGKVLPGDIITGVNGKPFKTPYLFGYWAGTGYEGPLMDVGRAIEESETKRDGKLTFSINRNGKHLAVDVQMPV
jgi:C-terminal processing protease CtpA/Prc